MGKYKRLHGTFLPNRIATMLLIAFGLAAAALPVLADMDWQSTTGILAGLGAVAAALVTWLRGWQKDEQANVDPFLNEPETNVPSPADELAAVRDELAAMQTEVKFLRTALEHFSTEIQNR